ncbi:hypothetical protein MANES_16G035200v8 [Manihot esculenta]|uniref:Uncharacterized protein n=1 Tax=Manihot esculenta TaxID=3983 RepID=A0A2C9UA90_MANES|nr:hypothetical protein MANES_16G035200v8 [Manihot esculenta]
MCSNTSLSLSGGGFFDKSGGSCGGCNGGYGVESIFSKKPKRQRVPKRGPGVAELEKILREQEKRPDFDEAKNKGFSLVSSLACSYQPKSPVLPPPNSLPKSVSFSPNPNHFALPTTMFYSNNSNSNPSPLGVGSGSGVALPAHALLPTTWNSCERPTVEVWDPRSASAVQSSTHLSNGSKNQLFPSPSLMQRSQQSSPSSITNLFPHPIVSSSTTSSSTAPSLGREPPSNQTSHHQWTALWPEEDKIVGAKRSRPFSIEMIPPVPTFRYQVPTFSPQVNRPEPSLACGSRSINNLEPCERTSTSREMKPRSSLEPNTKRSSRTDNEAEVGSFLLLGSPATPSSIQTQRESPTFSSFPFQESNVDSQLRPAQGGCFKKKPLYSFLLPRKQMSMVETSSASNNERLETRGDELDLSLRL